MYFDRAEDSDSFENEDYKEKFEQLLYGLKNEKVLEIQYTSNRRRSCLQFFPHRFSYSSKDDKLRVLGVQVGSQLGLYTCTLNISRIEKIVPSSLTLSKETIALAKKLYQNREHKQAIFYIYPKRNGLDRAMLHFASYEKQTSYEPEYNRFLCTLYYDKEDETELLIRLLSFGPVVEVLGPDSLLDQMRARVKKQAELLGIFPVKDSLPNRAEGNSGCEHK